MVVPALIRQGRFHNVRTFREQGWTVRYTGTLTGRGPRYAVGRNGGVPGRREGVASEK